jgi:hypothetical protein
MNVRTIVCAYLALLAPCAMAVNDPPLAEAWNIRPSGIASSSGDIVLRVTPPDGSDPVEITVPVLAGADDVTVARSIRRALNSQLRSDQFDVTVGEGANVLVTNPRSGAIFSVGLVTSDIDNMRIAVIATTPAATPVLPTAPAAPSAPVQSMPASTQTPAEPAGGVTPGTTSTPLPQKSIPTPQPATPTPQPSIRPPSGGVRPPNTGSAPPERAPDRPRTPDRGGD